MWSIPTAMEICIDAWVYTWRPNQDEYTVSDCDAYDDIDTDEDISEDIRIDTDYYHYYYYYFDSDCDFYNEDTRTRRVEGDDDKTTRVSVGDDGKMIMLGEYKIHNELTAKCIGFDNIDVTITTESEQLLIDWIYEGYQRFGKVEMCYSFPACSSGNIEYDPFVYYEGNDADSGFEVLSMDNSFYIISIATLIIYYDAIL